MDETRTATTSASRREAPRENASAPRGGSGPQAGGRARFDALFFDFDGVILESADIKTEVIVDIIPGLSPEQREELRRYHLQNLGISRFVKFAWAYRQFFGREIREEESERLGQHYGRVVYERVANVPFVPGAPEALSELASTYTLFVVSGTPTEEVQSLADERGIARHFAEIWGSPAKKPEIVRDLLSRYELAPERCLFIGDGESDYKAARDTGLCFVARDTPDQRAVWERLQPRRISDLSELSHIVKTWPA